MTLIRRMQRVFRMRYMRGMSDVRVICVGNMIAGGSGKTPVAVSLARYIMEHHKNVKLAFISTGYRGCDVRTGCVHKVCAQRAWQVGDEPLLLAEVANTYVSKSRFAAIASAAVDGANVMIMDDGLQDESVHKDLTINVCSAEIGIGNGLLIPLGPLRTTINDALRGTDVLLVLYGCGIGASKSCIEECDMHNKRIKHKMGKSETLAKSHHASNTLYDILGNGSVSANVSALHYSNNHDVVVGITRIVNAVDLLSAVKLHKTVFAFVGIAYPEKFMSGLQSLGISVKKAYIFRDHHQYTDAEIESVLQVVEEMQGMVVTTAKDAVRIAENYRKKFYVVEIEVVVDWNSVWQLGVLMNDVEKKRQI